MYSRTLLNDNVLVLSLHLTSLKVKNKNTLRAFEPENCVSNKNTEAQKKIDVLKENKECTLNLLYQFFFQASICLRRPSDFGKGWAKKNLMNLFFADFAVFLSILISKQKLLKTSGWSCLKVLYKIYKTRSIGSF